MSRFRPSVPARPAPGRPGPAAYVITHPPARPWRAAAGAPPGARIRARRASGTCPIPGRCATVSAAAGRAAAVPAVAPRHGLTHTRALSGLLRCGQDDRSRPLPAALGGLRVQVGAGPAARSGQRPPRRRARAGPGPVTLTGGGAAPYCDHSAGIIYCAAVPPQPRGIEYAFAPAAPLHARRREPCAVSPVRVPETSPSPCNRDPVGVALVRQHPTPHPRNG